MFFFQTLQILFCFLSLRAVAEPEANTYAGRDEMNGYRFSDYKEFEKKWHQVTVRFRKDTSEMRFVYANDKAWEVLKAGGTTYPEGAAFAKMALATEEDHSFPSSAVPMGIRRYQLMVFNKKRHAATDGWGYALFDAKGFTFPENPKTTVVACHACHSIVASRGYVFSQPMNIASFSSHLRSPAPPLPFTDTFLKDIPEIVRQKLPPDIKKVRTLQGPIRSQLFQGTLDEIRPTLAKEVIKSRLPALLISEDGKRFSVVFINNKLDCGKNLSLRGVHNIYFSQNKKYEIDFCEPIP
jgi:hypothetical protein